MKKFLTASSAVLIFSFITVLSVSSQAPDYPDKISALDAGKETYSYTDLLFSLRQNNPEIQTALEEYNCSLLDLNDAKASRGPTIDLQVSGTYMTNPPIGDITVNVDDIVNSIQWGDGYAPSTTGQYITVYDGMENTLYQTKISFTQPVFTWGKLTESVNIYSEVVNVKSLQLTSAEKKLETELETRLSTLDYLYQIMEIIQEEKKYADRLVSYSEDAEKSGMLLHQDVLDARIQALELDIATHDLEEKIKTQLLELSRITGIDDLTWQQIDYVQDNSAAEKILAMDRSEVQKEALSPERDTMKILSQLSSIKAMSEKIAKAYVNWKPDFALQIDAGFGGSRVPLLEPNWLRKDEYSLNVSVGMKTTIWDGGKKLNDVARKISDSKTTEITQEDTVASIKQQLQSLWNTIDVCTLRMEYQDLKIETEESKIHQLELVYNSGYGSETDLLSEKIKLCNERIEKIQQELNRTVSCYTIGFFLK